jgi:hypothetical protein
MLRWETFGQRLLGITVIVHLGPMVFIMLPPKNPDRANTAYKVVQVAVDTSAEDALPPPAPRPNYSQLDRAAE